MLHGRVVKTSMVAARRLRLLTLLACLSATALHAQLWEMTPTNLASWSDLDYAVASTYASFHTEFMIYPPGGSHFGLGGTFCTFSPDGELAALTNLCTCTMQLGVPTWQMNVTESHTSPRAWLYLNTSGDAFRTNPCPSSYDPTQWVQSVWNHEAPSFLTGTNIDQWYADRDRSRFVLTSTFVSSNDWPALQAAVHAAATNAPPPAGVYTPRIPTNAADIDILNILPVPGAMNLWVYTSAARPVAILSSTDLTTHRWNVLGKFGAVTPFNLWRSTDIAYSNFFYRVGFTDLDTDGDGIPDVIETFVLGTDPNVFDSTGGFLGDYYRLLIYGLDALSNSTVGDGIPDWWKIANGLDPLDPTVADQDPDGDSICNRAEYLLGTNPHKSSSPDSANAATLRTTSPLSR